MKERITDQIGLLDCRTPLFLLNEFSRAGRALTGTNTESNNSDPIIPRIKKSTAVCCLYYCMAAYKTKLYTLPGIN